MRAKKQHTHHSNIKHSSRNFTGLCCWWCLCPVCATIPCSQNVHNIANAKVIEIFHLSHRRFLICEYSISHVLCVFSAIFLVPLSANACSHFLYTEQHISDTIIQCVFFLEREKKCVPKEGVEEIPAQYKQRNAIWFYFRMCTQSSWIFLMFIACSSCFRDSLSCSFFSF